MTFENIHPSVLRKEGIKNETQLLKFIDQLCPCKIKNPSIPFALKITTNSIANICKRTSSTSPEDFTLNMFKDQKVITLSRNSRQEIKISFIHAYLNNKFLKSEKEESYHSNDCKRIRQIAKKIDEHLLWHEDFFIPTIKSISKSHLALSYENLQKDPQNTLLEIYSFLGKTAPKKLNINSRIKKQFDKEKFLSFLSQNNIII